MSEQLRSDLAFLRQVAQRALDGAPPPPAEHYYAALPDGGRHAACGTFTSVDFAAARPATVGGDLARLLRQFGLGELPFSRCMLVFAERQICIFEINAAGRLTDAYPTSVFLPPEDQAPDYAGNLELMQKVYDTGHRVHCPGCGRHLPRLRHVAIMGGVPHDGDVLMYALCKRCLPRWTKLADAIDRRVAASPIKYVLPIAEAQGRVKAKGRTH